MSENSNFNFSESYIKNSFSSLGTIFCFNMNYNGFSLIMKSVFHMNDADNFLIDIFETTIKIEGCFFLNNSNNLFMIYHSFMNITYTIFENNFCKNFEGCLLKISLNSKVHITKSIFLDAYNERDEGNIFISNSSFFLHSSMFFNSTNKKNQGNCISSYSGNLELSYSIFENNYGNCIFASNSKVKFNNLTMNHMKTIENKDVNFYGAFSCENCFSISIENSLFSNNSFVNLGSAIYISSKNPIESNILIAGTNFFNNLAFLGGCLYIQNQNASINNCIFETNYAFKGAGIFLINTSHFFVISYNFFISE